MTKRLFFTAALSAVVMAFGFSEALAQTDEVRAVTDVMLREAVAVEKGDLAALDKIWANTEDVTVFESGHANYGWNDYRNTHLAPELKEFKNTKYSFSDMKVKVEGKTAWATFKYALAADMGTRKIESVGLGTAILEKRDGNWRIVHWHSSAPRRAPAPAPSPSPKGI
ncbi:MAG: nuclear transport factor 2 family protein [Acidobacteriota bacterium]|nr:MAG: nuclear transport factor 2 family protein [Acidobacteriota bacterium]